MTARSSANTGVKKRKKPPGTRKITPVHIRPVGSTEIWKTKSGGLRLKRGEEESREEEMKN